MCHATSVYDLLCIDEMTLAIIILIFATHSSIRMEKVQRYRELSTYEICGKKVNKQHDAEYSKYLL